MSLSNPETTQFSLEDFEKGLMLAGLIAPAQVSDLEEHICLEEYEKQLREEKSRTYLKRAVLAAEIANELYEEPTFGRVKFQKLVYICEYVSKMNLEKRYSKQAAGPFDNKFMHSIEQEFKKQRWFEVQKIPYGNYSRSKYVPLPECNKYKTYYEWMFKDIHSAVHFIINLFRKTSTDTTEIAATLLACQIELIETNQELSNENILTLFYEWSAEKSRFSNDKVLSTLAWMKQQGIEP